MEAHTGQKTSVDWVGGLMFWLMLGTGCMLLACALVVPEWRNVEAASLIQQWEEYRIQGQQAQIEANRRQINALTKDPAAVLRLAQRDLNLPVAGVESVTVKSTPLRLEQRVSQSQQVAFSPTPVTPPWGINLLLTAVSRYDMESTICDPIYGNAMKGLSIAMIVLAFVLFARPTVDKSAKPVTTTLSVGHEGGPHIG